MLHQFIVANRDEIIERTRARVRGRSWPSIPKASRQWQTAVAIAHIVDQDLKDSAAPKALFFHARRVSPGWKLKRVAAIGNHIFYR